MDAFDYAFIKTLGAEGGYSDDESDRGGKTNFGITEAVFKDALNRMVISGVSDIKDLTVAQAKAIYKTDYWHKIRLGEIRNQEIAAEIFDTAVNMGRSASIKIVQESLNFLGEKLVVDGIIGPITIGTVNKWAQRDVRALFMCLNGFQFRRYADIIKNNPEQSKFARGWSKRIHGYKEA
jgi:lysozyme family protein